MNPLTKHSARALAAALFLTVANLSVAARPPAGTEGIEFFETKIRPVLADNCYSCHSQQSKKLRGGLLLDSKDGLLKGGDSGPAILPGDPEKSLVIVAIRYTNEDLQMPPKGKKLSVEQIGDFEAWVKMGAPDPRTGSAPGTVVKAAKGAGHWAFQPVRQPPLPEVTEVGWSQTPVDRFVLARLEKAGLTPAPRADKRTLIRRASFDLVGLPPSPAEVRDFLEDDSPGAFARVVDRLLASPHYGERWGRYWLDVARYADTKGYVFEEERRFPYSYTYRDYVIRSLNEDLPYNEFVIEQIAADRLELGDDKRPLAALGFLTLGRRFLNNQADIIDDRIDVVSRGMMGLTVGCARCHDHKFDPIPTADYYSLYGVFASCSEPSDEPLLGTASLPEQYPQYLEERTKRVAELDGFRATKERETRAKIHGQIGDYLLAAAESSKLEDRGKQDALARERKLDPHLVQRWVETLAGWRGKPQPIFGPWMTFSELPADEFEIKARAVVEGFAAESTSGATLNPIVSRAFVKDPPATLRRAADRYNELFASIEKEWQELSKKAEPAPSALPEPDRESLRQVVYGEGTPANPSTEELAHLFDTPTRQKLRALKRGLDELDATHPGAPPKAMALVDNPTPYQPHIFRRGNPNTPGEEVPRQFLKVLAGEQRKPFQHGSGRLELAQAIASPDNPLTARVLVNRVWLHHFGAALVSTPSDFGTRADPPTHPELLDYLAARFMAEGWSMKKLHRWIMLSSTYQQISSESSEGVRIDPNNQLLHRMNRQRLDFESFRDTLLAVSGKLDLAEGGRAVEITDPDVRRRTVYGFVERQNLPGLFRTFDFASPDTTSAKRFSTTVPQQALFLMNSPFIIQQARHLIQRADVASAVTDEEKIRRLYRLAFQRAPDPREIELARQFLHHTVDREPSDPKSLEWQYGFAAYRESSRSLGTFHPLPHFTGSAWQGGPDLPNPELGWVTLNAEGGHPGNDLRHAAVRRWTAPRDGLISVRGEIDHPSSQGDGVRGHVVSSQHGQVAEWIAQHSKVETGVDAIEVKRGDAIDFVIDCRGSIGFDSFSWAPVIQYRDTPEGERREWNAKADFSGPAAAPAQPLTPWEEYGQVLLLSNELAFVD